MGEHGGKAWRAYFSRFRPTLEAGGGCRRLLQLLADAEGLGLELISSARELCRLPKHSLKRVRQAVLDAGSAELGADSMWSEARRVNVTRLQEISRVWASDLPGLDDLELAVLDDPIYFQPLQESLVTRGVPVVAFAQNVEALAPDQVVSSRQLDLLRLELQVLAACRLVVTISHEESWLLTNLGIPNLHHPYYPAAPIRDRLLAVRGRRGSCRPDGVLMLGNAGNLQTLNGMRSAMAHWQRHRLESVAGPLVVAGFHLADQFTPGQFGPGVTILGTLGDDELDDRLVSTRACLCFQNSGAGMLTRITEMLLAGVPVLASTHAARSLHGAPGLLEFPDLDALEGALADLPEAPRPFAPPSAPDADRLRRALLAACRPASEGPAR